LQKSSLLAGFWPPFKVEVAETSGGQARLRWGHFEGKWPLCVV